MKFILVSRQDTPSQKWHIQQLREVAQKLQLEFRLINPSTTRVTEGLINPGDVIYWRSAKLEENYPSADQRTVFLLEAKHRGAYIINPSLINRPYLTFKSVQQAYIKNYFSHLINFIPTYLVADERELYLLIKKGWLNYPFIAKLNKGAQGKGSYLITRQDEIKQLSDLKAYIFQNFIPNDGDYRVMVVGGVAVAMMKRVRTKHPFLNNAAQGGEVYPVESSLKPFLGRLASRLATDLDLMIAGIDLIYHQEEKRWYFLEVNTVNQWQHLQVITPFNIAEKIVLAAREISKCRDSNSSLYRKVESYYWSNLEFISPEKQAHFLIRQYLWFGNKDVKNHPTLRRLYPDNLEEMERLVKGYLAQPELFWKEVVGIHPFRWPVIKKYPWLGAYNKIFFTLLFSHHLYGLKSEEVLSLLDKKLIRRYLDRLAAHPEELFILSSRGIDFIFLSRFFFPKIVKFDGKSLLQLKKVKLGNLTLQEHLVSEFYLLAHAVINASLFYAQPIKTKTQLYLKIIRRLEELISNNFSQMSLDQKLEFLVACRLLNYSSHLEDVILNQAQDSISPFGCYLVDKYNSWAGRQQLTDLDGSEHRNILYLMALTKPSFGL